MRLPLALAALLLAGCATSHPATPPPALTSAAAASTWPDGVAYEVFVRAFADSDGDGIGDLRGLTARLDHIAGLGAHAIWLMPISPSPSYHKYDVTDYLAVDPEYGTLDDARTFVREAHARGIAVVLDLVVNHTSRQHPWFVSAVADAASPMRGYYVWGDSAAVRARFRAATADTGTRMPWHRDARQGGGDGQRFYGVFGGHMPDLNFDHPDVRRAMIDVGRFWLREVGVDGFRLDAAKHIYEDDRAADSHAWWREFRDSLRTVREDVYLVGEVWDRPEVVAPYLPGLPSLFNFQLAGDLRNAVRTGRAGDVVERLAAIRRAYTAVNPAFVDATFLANHDQNRILSVVGDSVAKARVAASLLLTLPGAPFLYYGEELGMRGRKPDESIREPFPWGDAQTTTWRAPRHSTPDAVPPLPAQERDPASLVHHYRRLIALRNATPALGRGALVPVAVGDAGVVSFVRTHEGQELWVLHNVADRTATLAVPRAVGRLATPLFATDGARIEAGRVTLPPFASLVLR